MRLGLFVAISLLLSLPALGRFAPEPCAPAVESLRSYELAPMSFAYRWERSLGQFRGEKIRYFTDEEQSLFEVITVNNRWFYKKTGEVLEGNYLMIMEQSGRIIAHPPEVGLRHSSLAQGQPLASAGHLYINKNGELDYMSTHTGHYYRGFRDRSLIWRQFVRELRGRGFSLEGLSISIVSGDVIRLDASGNPVNLSRSTF